VPGREDLIAEYRRIHAHTDWGSSSVKHLRFIRPLVKLLNPKSVLDYGCGKSSLLDHLELGADTRLLHYDPAIPEYAEAVTETVDLLLNFDVLEHIETGDLDEVVSDMARLCRYAIIVVDTQPAALTLSDGRNAHVSLYDHEWWRRKLSQHFGEVYSFRVKRAGRAAFRTWPLSASDMIRFKSLRANENYRYLRARAAGRKF